jgi:hypothetical protein
MLAAFANPPLSDTKMTKVSLARLFSSSALRSRPTSDIEILQHGDICLCIRLGPVRLVDDFPFVFWLLTREMETFVRDVKEEGVFLVVLDEVDRGIRNQMGHVALAINGKTILEQHMKVAQLTID